MNVHFEKRRSRFQSKQWHDGTNLHSFEWLFEKVALNWKCKYVVTRKFSLPSEEKLGLRVTTQYRNGESWINASPHIVEISLTIYRILILLPCAPTVRQV